MRPPSKYQVPDENESEKKSISYYFDQLNMIYEEKAKKVFLWGEMDEEEKLVYMARLLRILQSEDDISVERFIEKALLEIKTLEEKNIREAIRDLLAAELVSIEEGNIKLTDAGKELLSAA